MTSLSRSLEINEDIIIGGPCTKTLGGPRAIKLFGDYVITAGNGCVSGTPGTHYPLNVVLDKDDLGSGSLSQMRETASYY
jgi:hypothetical protein